MAKHLIRETCLGPNLQRWFDWVAHAHSPGDLSAAYAG